MPTSMIRSSPPVPDEVNLREFRLWYTSKYHRKDDEVGGEEWDQMEGAKLSITTIKSMRGVDWEELSISFGTGKNLSRRAEVFEATVKNGEWLMLNSQLYNLAAVKKAVEEAAVVGAAAERAAAERAAG